MRANRDRSGFSTANAQRDDAFFQATRLQGMDQRHHDAKALIDMTTMVNKNLRHGAMLAR